MLTELQIILVIVFTCIINIISTLSYSVRIVGVRTKKIALSFSLFNIMVLLSRTANSFQAPLLAKWIEDNIANGINPGTSEIRCILLSTTIGTVIGALLIPSFQRMLSIAVINFQRYKSVPNLLYHAIRTNYTNNIIPNLKWPNTKNFQIYPLANSNDISIKIIIYNTLSVAIITVGVLSSMYAGLIEPSYRTTSSTLSSVVNSTATILMFIFIDPYLSKLTDEVVDGKFSEIKFRYIIRLMVISRFLGTIIAHALLVPFSNIIAFVSKNI